MDILRAPTKRQRLALVGVAAALLFAASLAVAPPGHADENLVEEIAVKTNTPEGTTSRVALEAGKIYRFEVSGLYSYSSAIGLYVADTECSRTTSDLRWRENRWGDLLTPSDPKDDPLDLYINGAEVTWRPLKGTESADGRCSEEAHMYEYFYSDGAGGQVRFSVYDLGNQDNVGDLTVKIYESVIEELVATATVDATLPNAPDGAKAKALNSTSDFLFDPEKTYRIEASGTYNYSSSAANKGDAECSTIGGDWQVNRYGIALTPLDPNDDPLDLTIDNAYVEWAPAEDADENGCNEASHTYQVIFDVEEQKPVRFKIQDFSFGDNAGSINVKVYETSFRTTPALSPPSAAPTLDPATATDAADDAAAEAFDAVRGFATLPRIEPVVEDPDLLETEVARATVATNEPDGDPGAGPAYAKDLDTSATYILEAGVTYRLEATGTFQYTSTARADAECTSDNSDPWQRDRHGIITPQDPFDDPVDLYVNNQNVDWRPTIDPDDNGCNEESSTYSLTFVPGTTGPVQFRIYEFGYTDNVGNLSVSLFRVDEELVETVVVDTRAPMTTSLTDIHPTSSYRLFASQVYSYNMSAASEADVECSRNLYDGWRPDRLQSVLGSTSDWLDLYVNGAAVTWTPVDPAINDPTGTGCNAVDHTYDYRLPSGSVIEPSQLQFAVRDIERFDNAGALVVKIYRCVAPAGCQ